MSNIKALYTTRSKALLQSKQRMEDIYHLIFDPSDIFDPENSVMTEDGAFVGAKRYRTYGGIRQEIEQISDALYATVGHQEKFIGLYADNSPRWIVLFWAILRSGNYPFLINLRQPEQVAEEILKTLDATVTVCVGEAPKLTQTMISYDTLLETKGKGKTSPTFGDKIALATSGTTLKRKVCIYTGKEISAQILNVKPIAKENSAIVTGYKGQIKHLAFLPFYHIFGLEAVLLWFSFFASAFVFPANMMPQTLMRTIREHSVTHIFAVPLFWDAVHKAAVREMQKSDSVERFEKGCKMSLKLQRIPGGTAVGKRLLGKVRQQLFGDSIRFCISGGSYISENTLEFFNGIGYPLCNGFGMSEIGISSVELSKKSHKRMSGAVGHPFDSVEYRISEDGHLLVRGDSICKEVIIDGCKQKAAEWMDTGDLVTADKDAHYHINGRVSDIVFGADGENLNPELAERAFVLNEAKQFSVLGDENNEKLILVVQIPGDLSEEQKREMLLEIDRTNQGLHKSYQIKKVYFTYDPLCDKKAIKVSRAWLRKAIKDNRVKLFTRMDEMEAPQGEASELKTKLREKVAAILSISPEEVIDHAHFMNDLGGSSLDFFALLCEIEEEYGISLDYEPEEYGYCLNDFERVLKEAIS